MDPEGDRGPETPPGKSQVALGFLRNTGTDLPEKQLVPLGQTASRGKFVWPSVKYFDDRLKKDRTMMIMHKY